MSKYVVVICPDEPKAFESKYAMTTLHDEDALSLYALAVIRKDDSGVVTIRDSKDKRPVASAIGMLTGAMLGLLAGPAGASVGAAGGAAIGAAGGGLVGSIADLNNIGVALDFIDMVGKKMDPDTAAVVAEIEEYSMTKLDSQMGLLGGIVFRQNRYVFEDEQWEQEVQAFKQDLSEIKEEMKQASDEGKAKLKAKNDELHLKLQNAYNKNQNKIKELKDEVEDKVAHLEKQISSAKENAKAKINERKEEVRAGYHARINKLKQAG